MAAVPVFLEQGIVHRAAPVPAKVTIGGAATDALYQKLITNGE
jgi:hypothetical protein